MICVLLECFSLLISSKQMTNCYNCKDPNAEPMNVKYTNWDEIDFKAPSQIATFRITSWNVDGIRAWATKNGNGIIQHDAPDILCFQETKCTESKLPNSIRQVSGYHAYWHSSVKEGYAGVGLLSKIMPIEVQYGINDAEQDEDARCLTAEFKKFYLINVYVPNAGRGLVTLPKRLRWNQVFLQYVKKLDANKPVIVCGDFNVAHREIDLTNPKRNVKNAGFTPEERAGMDTFLAAGYVDTFRHFYPKRTDAYTFWSYMFNARRKNIGWRLDYFLVSGRFLKTVVDSIIRNKVMGSDHCPITLFLNV